jgi:general secretion pathway protein M
MARKLTRREKYSIYAASVIIFLFIVIHFIVFPTVEKNEQQERALQVKTKILEEMIVLKSEYDAIKKNTDLSKVQFGRREKGFTLFSFLDKLTGEAGIKDNINYMKPSTSVQKNSPYKISKVEMKLQGITLQQLTSYLYMVETSKNMVRIKRLSISKTGKQEDFIDAVLQVETSEI